MEHFITNLMQKAILLAVYQAYFHYYKVIDYFSSKFEQMKTFDKLKCNPTKTQMLTY